MDDTSTPTDTLDQADEEILTHDVADDALEAAAAGTGRGALTSPLVYFSYCC